MTVLTRDYFDRQQCSEPGCIHTAHSNGLYISGRCHPAEPVYALVRDGVIVFTCAFCGLPVCDVAVAP